MEHTPKPPDEIDELLEGLPIPPANSPQPLQEGPQNAAQARRAARNLRDAGRIAKAAAATLQNPFAGVPVLPNDTEGQAGIFLGGEGRPKLIGRNPEATFYRNGRVVFNPPVVEWLKYVGWRSAELTYPPTHPEGSQDPPTHFWLEKGGNSSPVIRYQENGFAQYWQMGMSKRLRRAWPSGQWTTPVECSNDDTRDFPNMDFIRMPTHPKVHLRKSGFAIRPAPVPKEIRRVRKPQAGDVYANFKGKRRYILEAIPAKGDYKGKIVFSESPDGSDPITQTMLTFKAWISIGGRLLTPEETKIDPLDDLL
jgi:hypothetical protein